MGASVRQSFSRKIRVGASWTDHARDNGFEHRSRPWPTQEHPPRPLQIKRKKKKFVQGWSRPFITAVTTTWTTITAVTPRKRRGKLFKWWSRPSITPVTITWTPYHARYKRKREGNSIQEMSCPSITPVTMVYTTITAVIKAVTTSRSFFSSFFSSPVFSTPVTNLQGMITPVIIALFSPKLCFCFPNAFKDCYEL